MKTDGELQVFYLDRLVGKLWQEQNRLCFSYAKIWEDFPVSHKLLIGEEPFSAEHVEAFFYGLLPEGEILRTIKTTLRTTSRFEILKKLGGECAGALIIGDGGSTVKKLVPVAHSGFDKLKRDIKVRPFLAGETGYRLSLAGAQDKLPVYFDGDMIHLPYGGAVSSHILKPPNLRYEGLVENELFCMSLARAMELTVAPVQKFHDCLLVERYDRVKRADGTLGRLHQEDFCQALGIASERKYQKDGGPGIRECTALVRNTVGRLQARIDFMRVLIFNVFIHNADAHGKNFSIFYAQKNFGKPELAPFYDLLSTRPYRIERNFAMTIGGASLFEKMRRKNWELFAKDVGLGVAAVLDEINKMGEEIIPKAEKVRNDIVEQYGDAPILDEVMTAITKSCNHFRNEKLLLSR